jgi:CheY-like chemotaxis protein
MPTRILIADDYDDNRELLRLMLENAGYAVREARDGREFVNAARAEPPDVALIDLSMPVLDGWRALSELRADARTRSLPCVAVTAYAAEVDRQRAIAAGFDAYVTKPFRSTDLVEVVERLLKDGARDVDASPSRDDEAHPRAKKIGGTNNNAGHG